MPSDNNPTILYPIMTSIDIAQQVAWFLEGAFPIALALVGISLLTEGRK